MIAVVENVRGAFGIDRTGTAVTQRWHRWVAWPVMSRMMAKRRELVSAVKPTMGIGDAAEMLTYLVRNRRPARGACIPTAPPPVADGARRREMRATVKI